MLEWLEIEGKNFLKEEILVKGEFLDLFIIFFLIFGSFLNCVNCGYLRKYKEGSNVRRLKVESVC